MACALEKILVEEHANMKNQRFRNIVSMCPVVGRQICLWCCLHTHDVADPLSRNYASEMFPNLSIEISKISGRGLDSIWETCSVCQVR